MVEATHLGKDTQYKFSYDKSLLVPVDRSIERKNTGIDPDNIPFTGYDVWNCYEFSTLNNNGLPIIGILKIVYPCKSKCLVESKSLKLYLNGYSMTAMGDTEEECIDACELMITTDLTEILKGRVEVTIFTESEWRRTDIGITGYQPILCDTSNVICDVYKEDKSLLKIKSSSGGFMEDKLQSSIVRSCCKITHQPDFGTYFIKYRGDTRINRESLLKYLVSFRDEWHFHEECTELVYKRLHELLNPKDLCVACFYTRRGGIDINVIRSTSDAYALADWGKYVILNTPSFKLPRQ